MSTEMGVCPVCNGTGLCELSEEAKSQWWNNGRTHRSCTNCGAQTSRNVATGKVSLRKDNGQPCVHEYNIMQFGKWSTHYNCKHCIFSYVIEDMS